MKYQFYTSHEQMQKQLPPINQERSSSEKSRAWLISFSITRLHRLDLQFTKKVFHHQRAPSHFPKIFRTVPPSYCFSSFDLSKKDYEADKMNYDQAIKQKLAIKSYINHSFPMRPFFTLWKHQKTLQFSDVFRGWRKGALRTNGWSNFIVVNLNVILPAGWV